MGAFGIGNKSFRQKLADLKKRKSEKAARDGESATMTEGASVSVPSTVPDEVTTMTEEVAVVEKLDDIKEASDDGSEEAAEDAADDKWAFMNCCWGGAETSKAGFVN